MKMVTHDIARLLEPIKHRLLGIMQRQRSTYCSAYQAIQLMRQGNKIKFRVKRNLIQHLNQQYIDDDYFKDLYIIDAEAK